MRQLPTLVTNRAAVDYLRTAQAYMLISIPTETSTIAGFFQAMMSSRELQNYRRNALKIGPGSKARKHLAARDPQSARGSVNRRYAPQHDLRTATTWCDAPL